MKTFPLLSLLLLMWLLYPGCKRDACAEIACENGGICVEEGLCECPEGFSGDRCEVFDYSQFLGTYRVAYSGCFTTTPNHTVAIEQVSADSRDVYLYRLGDYACPSGELRLLASLSNNALIMDEQTVDCGAIVYTFSGSGTLSGSGQLSLSFSVRYTVDGFPREDNCTAMMEQ